MIRFTFCIIFVCNAMSIESVTVQTTLGQVKGKQVQDEIFNLTFYSFEGIPYAEPPVGSLRFKAPVQKKPWSNVFSATKPGHVCPQSEFIHTRSEMNEDCLTFNVFTPTAAANSSLPVMFVIHGGDFNLQSGKASPIYGPQLHLRNNNVVVTINYRLGPLGFLSLFTEAVPGNAGVKDTVLALKIVHDNIRAFGGDPNKITLLTGGAGACMGQLLMLTNQTAGLFRNVIFHSGSILSPKCIQLNPREKALTLARELSLNTSSDARLMKQLRSVNAFDIIKAQEAITKRDPQRGFRYYLPFKPTVEVEHEGAVLTKTPLALMTEGAIRDVPMIMAFNDQEGLEIYPLLMKEPQLIDKLNANVELLIPEDIQYPEGSTERKNLSARIRSYYFNGGNITYDNIQSYLDLVSDAYYTFATELFVKLYKDQKTSPVYYFLFGADTELNWFKTITNITFVGAAHADNRGYILVTSATKSKYNNLSSAAKQVQDGVILILNTFSTTGDLTSDYLEAGESRYYTVVNNDGAAPVYSSPIPNRIAFWKSVYDQYHAYVALNS